jgi:endonuclease YncB( thermonuclease family)
MPTRARAVLRALALLIRLPGRLLINTLDGLKARNGVGPLNRFQRGAVHGFVWLCALIVFSMASNPAPTSTASTASSTAITATTTAVARPTSTPTTSSRPASTAPAQPAFGSNPETVTVATVTDGDTFQLTDGRKVRVLGIDSCEDTGASKTPGGAQATAAAVAALDGKEVILTAEPGVHGDTWGRVLRYVWQDEIGDFGLHMVPSDHTGVYQGDNDASQSYLDQLYAHDLDHAANPPSGQERGEYPPPAPAPNHDDAYVPLPDNDDDDRGGRFCGRWNPIC